MTISRREDWVQIAELDDQDQIRLTSEFQQLVGDLGWEAKAFVGHLLALWYDPFEHLLDYTSGEATSSRDQPGSFDRNGLDEAQDVVEYWAVEWAKLVSLRLPQRLILDYKTKLNARIAELDRRTAP